MTGFRDKARVMGTCYCCGKKVYGRRTVDPDRARRLSGNVAVRDGEGVRHSRCNPPAPRLGAILEV